MIEIISFGYLHGVAPKAHITVDLREHFRDPHVSPELRELTGLSELVYWAVIGTDGITDLVESLFSMAEVYLSGPSGGDLTVAIGCAGGRHRSVVVAQEVASLLMSEWHDRTTLNHRDVNKPVVERPHTGIGIVHCRCGADRCTGWMDRNRQHVERAR